MSKPFLKNLAPLFFGALFFLLAGEICVRIYLKNHIVYDVEMSHYSLKLKRDSPNPRIDHIHKSNASARLMGVWIRTNSDGFRDSEHSLASAGKKRIVFLGDSLTLGWGVENKDTFKKILEQQLSEKISTEIINTGTGNYNTEQEVNLFIEQGLKYKLDKVVVFYFINDAEPTPKKSGLWFLGYSRFLTLYWSRLHTLTGRWNPSGGYRAYYSGLYADNKPGLERTKAAFLLLRNVCQENNILLQVVLLPELHELQTYPFAREHKLITDFLTSNSIDCLDLAPYFSTVEHPRELWVAKDDAHPNSKGHRLIAQHALAFIKKGLCEKKGP